MNSNLRKFLAVVAFAGTIITTEETAYAAGNHNLFTGPQGKIGTILSESQMEDLIRGDSLVSENKGEYLNITFSNVREEAEEQIRRPLEEKEEKRQAVVDYACKFIGNPYVWGGTSLTSGADCSGFVQSVYAHFGVSLPRTSSSQRSAGEGVSYEEVLPGDIICYEGHVGIYIGNGQIVNARTPATGIGITPANYKNILAVRRVI